MKYSWAFFLMSMWFYNCKPVQNKKEIIEGRYKIVGNISNDSNYEGLVKFYDIKTDKLLYESNYHEGKLKGETKYYNYKGDLVSVQNFLNNELNGFSYLYNKDQTSYSKTFYYYGIRVGPTIEYRKGIPYQYQFFSLENEPLFKIEYDSVAGKKISDLQQNFFFLHFQYFDKFEDGIFLKNQRACFTYLLNPPKYKFDYSLVKIDSSYKVLSTLSKIDNTFPFTTIDFPIVSNKQGRVDMAIKLDIYDSINDVTGHFFKKIFP